MSWRSRWTFTYGPGLGAHGGHPHLKAGRRIRERINHHEALYIFSIILYTVALTEGNMLNILGTG